MDKIIKRALSIRGWKVDFSGEYPTYYRLINGILACVTIHGKEIKYRLKGVIEMVISYEDISIIEDEYMVLNRGLVLIGNKH